MEARPVSYSKTTITELMIPSYSNFGGKIHGGILLSLMDKVAYACASKHAGHYCVTVSVDKVNFLQPVEVGDLVSMAASVNYVGNSSLIVGIKVTAEDVLDNRIKHTNSSYFTMVAKDSYDLPTQVPPLLLENKEDLRRFLRAMHKKKAKKSLEESLPAFEEPLKIIDHIEDLKDQRCTINFSDDS